MFDPAPDAVSATRDLFAGAAAHLQQTGYADACPIVTVALEISSTSEPMRRACADVFESWLAAGAQRFIAAGIDPAVARELAIALVCAFVLARATRDPAPLRVAGALTAGAVPRALQT